MSVAMQRDYGKPELVELLTGVKNDRFLRYLEAATNAPLTITPDDMPKVHQAVLSYKANRIKNYGEHGAYTQYFAPAFQLIEEAFAKQDFGLFKHGCVELLELIAAD